MVTEPGVSVAFTNSNAFKALGYKLNNVITTSISNYRVSSSYFIVSPNQSHPWGSWILDKGIIYYSIKDGLIGVPNMAVFSSNGGSLTLLLPANKADISILNLNPNLPVLQNQDDRVYKSE